MKQIIAIVVLGLILNSCVKNNQDAVWLKVSEWQLESNGTFIEGELTHNISDAWVYIDNKLIGVFEVPFKIPVLVDGNKKITIYPTVLNNGISATKKIYPFLEPYEITTDLVSNDTLELVPTTRYYPNTEFSILDFEGATTGFLESPDSPTAIAGVNDPSIMEWFNGNKFGRVTLNQTDNYWKAATEFMQILPQGGAEVYLELDYYNTNSFVTGVAAVDGSEVTENPNVQVNPQDPSTIQWKKIYIDLKTIVSGSPTADYFEHTFEAIIDDSETNTVINIDNLKVVHF